ncbi:MAG: SAM-dependent methyltransferase [Anaerolineae bacterium]|nr:MAG: SAM-dependent methyltransferase [Anaerolineae bacterium]
MASNPLPSSFRDPNGYLFSRAGVLYRAVNASYQPHYERLMGSGLYDDLVKRGWLVAHTEGDAALATGAWKVLQPERLPFISYPYEWAFSQLKDAALLTLRIQQRALKQGLTLKDASAYNIQFRVADAKPVLIDTLSFEVYEEGRPWVAYRQFCQHFLAPLALMAHTDVRLGQLLRVHIDGIPLDLTSRLLPSRTRLNGGLLTHIHLHAAAQRRYAGQKVAAAPGRVNQTQMLALIDSLKRTVERLDWTPTGTDWGDYYDDTNYTDAAMEDKAARVKTLLEETHPASVWDLGANTGRFSRLAAGLGIPTLAWDIDPAAVEKGYRQVRADKGTNILPLLLDLTNPSPSLGWANAERDALATRGPAGALLALALVHHLAIGNNLPLGHIATFFASLAPVLIIEFVPKEDSQVQRLLASREDIFPDYTQAGFEAAFSSVYHIRANHPVQGTPRRIYRMERR